MVIATGAWENSVQQGSCTQDGFNLASDVQHVVTCSSCILGLDNLFFPIFRELNSEALKFLIFFPRYTPTLILVICKIASKKQIAWKLTETWTNKS